MMLASYRGPTNRTILRGASGYFAAGVACTLAGYSLARETLWPVGQDLAQLSVFWLLLAAGLANHAALYEQRGMEQSHEPIMHAFAREVPIGMTVAALIGGFIYHDAHRADPGYDARWFLPLVVASLPLGFLTFHRTLRWRDPRISSFRSRSYFPALATCLPSFVLGYYLERSLGLLLASGLLILSLWILSLRVTLIVSVILQSFLLLVAIAFVFFESGPIRVWIFGVFLTLAMGVSEAWRVTTRIIAGVEYRPTREYTPSDQEFFLGATNMATALFLPLFITTYLHPQTEPLYLLLVTTVVATGYLLWFWYGGSAAYLTWTAVAFCFGISLPLIVGFATRMRGDVPLPRHLDLQRLGAPYTVILGLALLLANTVRTHIRMYVRKQSLFAHYAESNNAIALTGGISALLGCIGMVTAFGLDLAQNSGPQRDRLSWLILIYIVFALVSFLYTWIRKVLSEELSNA